MSPRADPAAGRRRPPGGEAKRILVVEDDADVAELIRVTLEDDGLPVTVVADGERALAALGQAPPALVVLDLMLPGISGLEVCRRLRADADTARLPIVIVTAKASEADRVVGLELGADDYLTKPFSARELVARIRAVLRRAYGEDSPHPRQLYERGRLRIDFDAYEVWVGGRRVAIALREFELLRFFVRFPNRVHSRTQILRRIWGPETRIEPRSIDVYVHRLRQQIERDESHPELIVTVRGVGFKFDERVLER
jgi:DNA-binding response OmpR family regulator